MTNCIDVTVTLHGTITDPNKFERLCDGLKDIHENWTDICDEHGAPLEHIAEHLQTSDVILLKDVKWGQPGVTFDVLKMLEISFKWEHGETDEIETGKGWWTPVNEGEHLGDPDMIDIGRIKEKLTEFNPAAFKQWIYDVAAERSGPPMPPWNVFLKPVERVYAQEVWICATAYVKATSPEEADRRIASCEMTEIALGLQQPDIPVSDTQLDDPDLPELSLSPCATVHWSKREGKPEIA